MPDVKRYLDLTSQEGFILADEWGNKIISADGSLTLTPDDGVTYIKLEPGKITIHAAEVITHATAKNVWDAGGTGFVYQPGVIDNYTQGITPTPHPPNPPEVPT